MNQTALQFYKWTVEHYDHQLKNRMIAESKAKEYCRERWFEFGEKVIRRALKMPNCTSLRGFECLCLQIKDFTFSKVSGKLFSVCNSTVCIQKNLKQR